LQYGLTVASVRFEIADRTVLARQFKVQQFAIWADCGKRPFEELPTAQSGARLVKSRQYIHNDVPD
jgi:hypothetical protein